MAGNHILCGAFGLAAGIFTGYVSTALAQILQVWCLKENKRAVLWAMVLGKIAGAFYYFFIM